MDTFAIMDFLNVQRVNVKDDVLFLQKTRRRMFTAETLL